MSQAIRSYNIVFKNRESLRSTSQRENSTLFPKMAPLLRLAALYFFPRIVEFFAYATHDATELTIGEFRNLTIG